jgi:hypothetical protein
VTCFRLKRNLNFSIDCKFRTILTIDQHLPVQHSTSAYSDVEGLHILHGVPHVSAYLEAEFLQILHKVPHISACLDAECLQILHRVPPISPISVYVNESLQILHGVPHLVHI